MPDSELIKKDISMKEYCRKLNFGFGSGKLQLPAESLDECCDRNGFQAVEVSYEQFSRMPVGKRSYLFTRFPMIYCGNLLSPSLTALIPYAGIAMQRDFIAVCKQIFRKMKEDNLPAGSLDFSLTAAMQDPERLAMIRQLLQKLHPVLQETGRLLLLPVRLRGNDPDLSFKISKFLTEMMIPSVKLCLEIYPHELKPDHNPENIAGRLYLETRAVMFCANADCGNRLLPVHLRPWLRYFSRVDFRGPFLFVPFSHENRLAQVESEACAQIVGKLDSAFPN